MAQNEALATTRLYLITPPALDPDRFAKELEEALAVGDVASLQLRLKDCDDDTIRRAARVLKPIAQHGTTVVSLQSRSNSGSARYLAPPLVGLGKNAPNAT